MPNSDNNQHVETHVLLTSQGERLAVIEERLRHIAEKLEEHIAHDAEVQKEVTDELKNLGKKLDGLLEIKHKGLGVFWVGASFVGIIVSLLAGAVSEFIRGLIHGG